jgi:dynein heavy chain
LHCRYEESSTKKRVLEEELADLEGKLARAEKLVTGLAGERVRWEASITGFEAALAALPGDALLAAAFLSYAGPFPSEYRDHLVAKTWLPQVRTGKATPGPAGCASGRPDTMLRLLLA